MKKLFIVMMATAGLTLAGCSSNEEPENLPEKKKLDITLTRGEKETLNSINEFAFDLFKAVDAEKIKEQENQKGFNYLISPFGASTALGMLANGAQGETLKEITDMLKIGDGSLEDLNECSRTLINAFTAPENGIDLTVTNTICPKAYSIQSNYLSKVEEFYKVTVTDKSLVKGPELEMTDVLEFRGRWDNVFNKKNTKSGIFKNADGSEGEAYFMNSQETTFVSEDETCRMLRKTMDKGSFSFYFIIPSDGKELQDVMSLLSPEYLEKKAIDFKQYKTTIRMPKFKMEEDETSLMSPVQSLGMIRAFDKEQAEIPDILAIEGNIPLNAYVNYFKQKSTATVDEEGAYIKVETIIGLVGSSIKPSDETEFILDRPFIYIVTENSTDAILFMGKVSRFKDFELY